MKEKQYPPVLVVSLNPTVQKTLVLDDIERGGVNRSSEYLFSIGGKGANTSRVMRQLGHNPVYLTQAGGQMRPFFLAQMEEDGVRTEWVESNSEIRFCYTIIIRDPYSATEIVENGEAVDSGTDGRIRKRFGKLLPECEALIIAGSKTAGFSDSIYLDMMMEARRQEKTVVIDLADEELRKSLEHAPSVIKINLFEFITAFMPDSHLSGQKIEESWYGPVAEKAVSIYRETGSRFVLSNGKDDTLVVDGENISRITPEQVKVVNPIGSGDSFNAGLTAGLIERMSLHEAAARGMECAKLNLGLLKTGTIT